MESKQLFVLAVLVHGGRVFCNIYGVVAPWRCHRTCHRARPAPACCLNASRRQETSAVAEE
eukprot:8684636-Alexandrium_andersonii.AAC.1